MQPGGEIDRMRVGMRSGWGRHEAQAARTAGHLGEQAELTRLHRDHVADGQAMRGDLGGVPLGVQHQSVAMHGKPRAGHRAGEVEVLQQPSLLEKARSSI